MNTQEYINELKTYLRKLDDDDREDAIAYYFEYLAEAGPEGAEEAMERLGAPEKLAAGIRADQAMTDFEEYEGRAGGAFGKGVQAVWHAGRASIPRTVLAVFVTVIIIIVFFAVIIALFAASIALIAGGALSVAGSVWALHIDWAAALFYGGCGLVIIVLGSLLLRFSVWSSKHLLHTIAKIFNGIRHNREQRQYREAQKQQMRNEQQWQGAPQSQQWQNAPQGQQWQQSARLDPWESYRTDEAGSTADTNREDSAGGDPANKNNTDAQAENKEGE